jgi:hypothetical protein
VFVSALCVIGFVDEGTRDRMVMVLRARVLLLDTEEGFDDTLDFLVFDASRLRSVDDLFDLTETHEDVDEARLRVSCIPAEDFAFVDDGVVDGRRGFTGPLER